MPSHKPHPLITGTILLTAAGLLPRPRLFYWIFLSRTIGAEGLGIYQDDLSGLRIFSPCARRLDPDCDLLFHRSGAGTCEADACFPDFSFPFHVTSAALMIRHFSGFLAGSVLMEPRCARCSPSWPLQSPALPSMPVSAATTTERKRCLSLQPPSSLNR